MTEIRVGLIGFGFIGKVHAIAYRNLPFCYLNPPVAARLAAVLRSGRMGSGDIESQRAAGFERITSSLDEFTSQPLDLVDICTPNFLHFEQIIPLLEARIPVYCEKPLAINAEQARILADLAETRGVPTQVAFTNRYIPAIRQMKAAIEAGMVGEVYHFRAKKFHSSYLDPFRPMSWRLRMAQSGGGALMDLGIHLIDLVHYLLGKVAAVRAEMRTFIAERPAAKGSDQMEKVDVDDWALCNLELASGARGFVESTRVAAGRDEVTSLEIYGSRGSLVFHEETPEQVEFFDLKLKRWQHGLPDLPPPAGERPNAQIWPGGKLSQGEMTNKHTAAIYDLLLNLAEGKMPAINFRAGQCAQEVVEACSLSAAQNGERVSLSD